MDRRFANETANGSQNFCYCGRGRHAAFFAFTLALSFSETLCSLDGLLKCERRRKKVGLEPFKSHILHDSELAGRCSGSSVLFNAPANLRA